MYDSTLNLHDHHTHIQNPVVTDGPIHELLIPEPSIGYVCESGTGYQLPDADAYTRRLAEEAEAWLRHARERSRMKDGTLIRKALQGLAFTLRHRAHDLAIPSKLMGTSKHQATLWQMVKHNTSLGSPLDIEEVEDGSSKRKRPRLVVSFDGEELGEVQSKHVPWVRPLLPFGAGIRLVRVTGTDSDYTLGCNVLFGRVGGAVTALNHALGTDVGGDGYGGDGASQAPVGAAPMEARPLPHHGGDGAPSSDGSHGGNGVRDHRRRDHGRGEHLRLVSPALPVAKPHEGSSSRPDASASDVVLYREIDGTAKATVGTRPLEHVVRHSPTGLEWGYAGSGPADLARSILLQFTDEATAESLYQRFKAEVVASIPIAGGVVRAAEVRAFIKASADQR